VAHHPIYLDIGALRLPTLDRNQGGDWLKPSQGRQPQRTDVEMVAGGTFFLSMILVCCGQAHHPPPPAAAAEPRVDGPAGVAQADAAAAEDVDIAELLASLLRIDPLLVGLPIPPEGPLGQLPAGAPRLQRRPSEEESDEESESDSEGSEPRRPSRRRITRGDPRKGREVLSRADWREPPFQLLEVNSFSTCHYFQGKWPLKSCL